MLKNLNIKNIINENEDEFLKMLTDDSDCTFVNGNEVIPGIYITDLNVKNFLIGAIVEEWESFCDNDNYRDNYGVCDNHKQVLKEYPELTESPDRNFVVLMTPILKSEQSEKYGWRWHKWGEYIGDMNPSHEYLYDEPDIEKVYVYHIYEVL